LEEHLPREGMKFSLSAHLRAAQDSALLQLLPKVVIETQDEPILKVFQLETASKNVYLRPLHNFLR
jgi:hypothetical protein